jgi:hypothetical protein
LEPIRIPLALGIYNMSAMSMFITVTIAAALSVAVGFSIAYILLKSRSKKFRQSHGIPDILGRWRCLWYDEKDDTKPKVEDTVEIRSWIGDGEFKAVGLQPQYDLEYPLIGEIDSSRIITLEYRASKYPYEQNRGIALLELSRDGKTMEGRWFGRRSTGVLSGGKVSCSRIR